MKLMTGIVMVGLGLALAGLTACGDDTSGSGGSGAQGGAGGTGGTGAQGGAGGTGGTGGQGGTGGGDACGLVSCEFLQYCVSDDGQCGAMDPAVHCEDLPPDCIYPPETWEPVCGCNGTVYPIDCQAAISGVDVGPADNCTTFPCGDATTCDIATEYCQRGVSDVGGEPDTWTCLPLPAGCGDTPDCLCVQAENCGDLCDGDGPLGLRVTCPGG
jgi:hypothetical protein